MNRLNLLIIPIFIACSSFAYAQIFTIDYLNYSEQHPGTSISSKNFKSTSWLFLGGKSKFNEDSKVISKKNAHSESGFIAMYSYIAGKLYDWEKFNINIAFQASIAIGSDGSADRGWGTPWIWTNLKPFSNIPIWLCLGYEFANIGSELGEGDNKANIGLLSRYKIGSIAYNASIHFRMRGKVERSLEGYFNRTEQPGDEIHYKFEPSKKIAKNKQLSVFAIGYYGRDRKIDGEIIPDSRRYKASLGSSYTYSLENGKILLFSTIADIYGCNEEKGVAFIFNVLW